MTTESGTAGALASDLCAWIDRLFPRRELHCAYVTPGSAGVAVSSTVRQLERFGVR
jgi:hypothetical protein